MQEINAQVRRQIVEEGDAYRLIRYNSIGRISCLGLVNLLNFGQCKAPSSSNTAAEYGDRRSDDRQETLDIWSRKSLTLKFRCKSFIMCYTLPARAVIS